jgi:hypothetical protein
MNETLEASKYLYVGVFRDEKVLQFLNILQQLSDDCFSELHQVASKNAGVQPLPSESNNQSAYGLAFQSGLNTIRQWNSGVMQKEVDKLKSKYSFIEDLYKYSVTRFVYELYMYDRPQSVNVHAPLFREFLHRFYMNVANNEITKGLKYFSTLGLEKKNLMMDCFRKTMFDLLENQIDYHSGNSQLLLQKQKEKARESRPWSKENRDELDDTKDKTLTIATPVKKPVRGSGSSLPQPPPPPLQSQQPHNNSNRPLPPPPKTPLDVSRTPIKTPLQTVKTPSLPPTVPKTPLDAPKTPIVSKVPNTPLAAPIKIPVTPVVKPEASVKPETLKTPVTMIQVPSTSAKKPLDEKKEPVPSLQDMLAELKRAKEENMKQMQHYSSLKTPTVKMPPPRTPLPQPIAIKKEKEDDHDNHNKTIEFHSPSSSSSSSSEDSHSNSPVKSAKKEKV